MSLRTHICKYLIKIKIYQHFGLEILKKFKQTENSASHQDGLVNVKKYEDSVATWHIEH